MALFGSKKNTKAEEAIAAEPVKKPAKVKTSKVAKAAPQRTQARLSLQGDSGESFAKSAVATPKAVQNKDSSIPVSFASIIYRPRITEKASDLSAQNAYAFEVAESATKATVSSAIQELYKVVPVKVAILRIPTRNVIIRNKRGIKRGGKKAYVYLQKGQTIELT